MTGDTDPDDGWADLARELGLEQPSRPPSPSVDSHTMDGECDTLQTPANGHHEPFTEYDSEAEDSEETAEIEEGEPNGDPGEEGPKKKRRRRRRRKKKGGEGGEVATLGNDESEDENDGATEETSSGSDEQDEEPAHREPMDDGGPTAEASRELIANWDVPSWEQIVAGLYRPGGR